VKQQRIIVGMSGGVDSSVAALRLIQAGHEVHGLFMSNWAEDEEGYCQSAEDFQGARAVSELLGIPLHYADFSREYRERVFAAFLDGYRSGLTPNPDVLCNREIKFGTFLEHAQRLGAARIATGHYARTDGAGRLLRAADAAKDQTYFLHAVPRAALLQTVFPLGELHKPEVRAIAKAGGLPNHDRPDSTGICFIGERPFAEFLARHLDDVPGYIEDAGGRVLARHAGLSRYTLGQRHGLQVGGVAGAGEAPWYVARKDAARNVLVVVQGHDHPALFRSSATATDPHWIAGAAPELPLDCTARHRHRQPEQACRVTRDAAGDLSVRFQVPQRALTPGQYVVFYSGEECLGGATIAATGTHGALRTPGPSAVSA
jgi:tRNA-uridine 2-sulfurtransferase